MKHFYCQIILVINVFLVLSTPSFVLANNKFGIHVLSENDFPKASEIVNQNGREWGYVTFVIREDEMDPVRWSSAFEKLTEYKLIPIVRIATTQGSNGVWTKPSPETATKWATFLDQLPWPQKKRIVSLWNEPNHAKEWGGTISPVEYAAFSRRFWEELKKASFDFYVLPAGFDGAAPNSESTMDSQRFFDQMNEYDPLIFTIFDGWASHSYPNPDFSASPSENGKMSVRGFEWEINYLQRYHLSQNIEVYIKETGWKNTGNNQEKIADYYKQAFSEAWNTPRVVAVTPFILRYDQKPFKQFSWIIPNTDILYPYSKVLGEQS